MMGGDWGGGWVNETMGKRGIGWDEDDFGEEGSYRGKGGD
jgi:hypothetical protein